MVFYGDEQAQRLLVDGLQLPFEYVHDLAPIPDELGHVYDLPKLSALLASVQTYGPTWHHDHDAHFSRRPSDAMLAAPFVCEFRYNESHNPLLYKQTREFNAKLAHPLPEPSTALATGIMGGTDVAGIAEYCQAGIRAATREENRAAFAAREPGDGYWKSVLIGEMGAGTRWPNAHALLPDGGDMGANKDERRASGWYHLAGGKTDSGLLCMADNLFRDDFPQERAELFRRWRVL